MRTAEEWAEVIQEAHPEALTHLVQAMVADMQALEAALETVMTQAIETWLRSERDRVRARMQQLWTTGR